jgi:hypothetical protein
MYLLPDPLPEKKKKKKECMHAGEERTYFDNLYDPLQDAGCIPHRRRILCGIRREERGAQALLEGRLLQDLRWRELYQSWLDELEVLAFQRVQMGVRLCLWICHSELLDPPAWINIEVLRFGLVCCEHLVVVVVGHSLGEDKAKSWKNEKFKIWKNAD